MIRRMSAVISCISGWFETLYEFNINHTDLTIRQQYYSENVNQNNSKYGIFSHSKWIIFCISLCLAASLFQYPLKKDKKRNQWHLVELK